jgi:hypothetical protein
VEVLGACSILVADSVFVAVDAVFWTTGRAGVADVFPRVEVLISPLLNDKAAISRCLALDDHKTAPGLGTMDKYKVCDALSCCVFFEDCWAGVELLE